MEEKMLELAIKLEEFRIDEELGKELDVKDDKLDIKDEKLYEDTVTELEDDTVTAACRVTTLSLEVEPALPRLRAVLTPVVRVLASLETVSKL